MEYKVSALCREGQVLGSLTSSLLVLMFHGLQGGVAVPFL